MQVEWRVPRRTFLRQAIFDADGNSFLSLTEDRRISIHNSLRNDTYCDPSPRISYKVSSACLSLAWYPYATTNNPALYCFVQSTRDCPVALVDATTGKKRASYPIIDHTERFVGPHAMVFSADCRFLYCGHENAIEIFDFTRNGEAGERIATRPTRRSKDGQKGIISSLSISPYMPTVLATGSFSHTCALYDISSGAQIMQVFSAAGSGVTQVAFHPSKPELYVASRQSEYIECFDVRSKAEVSHKFKRSGRTNQRLLFDISKDGQYLVCGDDRGLVTSHNLQNYTQQTVQVSRQGAVGSVHFHPANQDHILATTGSRQFPEPTSSESTSSQEDDDDDFSGSCLIWKL